jgi:hypothetical protein
MVVSPEHKTLPLSVATESVTLVAGAVVPAAQPAKSTLASATSPTILVDLAR